jgi:spermidine/putrescine transport system substrate-binding protein
MIDSQIDSVTVAALHAGLDPFRLTPAGIVTVRRLLQEQRPLLRMYTSDNSAIVHALASGEVVAALAWSSDYAELKAAGLPVAFMRPREGHMTWVCGAGIHANARNPGRAHELIDALISPAGGAYTIERNGTGASNLKAFERVPETSLGLSRDPQALLAGGVFQSEQQHAREIGVMFEEVKLGL